MAQSASINQEQPLWQKHPSVNFSRLPKTMVHARYRWRRLRGQHALLEWLHVPSGWGRGGGQFEAGRWDAHSPSDSTSRRNGPVGKIAQMMFAHDNAVRLRPRPTWHN